MSYHAPKTPAPEKPLDPVINMAEMQQATDLQKNQRGMMSTYLQGGVTGRGRISDYLRGADTARQAALGSATV